MGINQKQIYDYISNIGKEADLFTAVWAVKMPSVFNMVVFGSMAILFDLRYNILSVSQNEIIIIGVDAAGRLTPYHVCLEKKEIQNVIVKNKLRGSQIEIVTENGKLIYQINKIMVGSGFHKENYPKAMQILKQFSNE